MSFRDRCCFFDVSSVVKIVPGGVRFHEQLPGHLGDLFAIHGRLVGIAFDGWMQSLPNGVKGLQEALYGGFGMPPLRVVALNEKDPVSSMQELCQQMYLDTSRCTFCLGVEDSRMEKLARDAGIQKLLMFDPHYLR